MKAKKILFVGGPSDGYRKDDPRTNANPVIHSIVPNNPITWVSNKAGGVSVCTYTIKKFKDENGNEYEVAFDSSVKNPMEALIKGYRYHRNKRRFRKVKNAPYWNPRGFVYPHSK